MPSVEEQAVCFSGWIILKGVLLWSGRREVAEVHLNHQIDYLINLELIEERNESVYTHFLCLG